MRGSSPIGSATDPDETAIDGENGHSPFTRALLHHILVPGTDDISLVLRAVRHDVLRATENRQRPTVVDNLLERVVLNLATPPRAPLDSPTPPTGLAPAIVAEPPSVANRPPAPADKALIRSIRPR